PPRRRQAPPGVPRSGSQDRASAAAGGTTRDPGGVLEPPGPGTRGADLGPAGAALQRRPARGAVSRSPALNSSRLIDPELDLPLFALAAAPHHPARTAFGLAFGLEVVGVLVA